MLKITPCCQVFGSCDFCMAAISVKYFFSLIMLGGLFLDKLTPELFWVALDLSSRTWHRLNHFYGTNIFLYPWRSKADHRHKGTASALSSYRDADNQSIQGQKPFQITFQNALYILEICFLLLKSETRYLQRNISLP